MRLLSLGRRSAACLLVSLAVAALQAASTPTSAVLVLEKEQNSLVIVDPASLTIVARVPVGDNPHEVAVSDDGKTAYVSNYGGSTIAVVDLVAQKALTPIELGALRAPHGLMFVSGKLYFTAEAAKVVGRYDPATQKIDLVIGTGQNRTHMVTVSKDLKTVFTSNVSSATISIIQQGAAQGPGRGPGGPPRGGPGGPPRGGGPGGRGPGGPPPGRGGGQDWIIVNVPVGNGSEGFDLTPDDKELWVANAQDSTISVIDVAAKKVIETLPSTGSANRLKVTPDGKYVFVSDLSGNDLWVIDAATRKIYKKIALPANSEGLLMSPDGTKVYTTMNTRDAVAVIDLKTMTMTGEVKTGRGPDGLAWAQRK